MDLFRLDGQVAIVTGAGSGIGQAIAIGLAEAGADVGCFSRPGSKGLSETVKDVERYGRRALALNGSVGSEAEIQSAVDKLQKTFGPLTVAVNAAGIANVAPAEDMDLDQWQGVVDTNYTGVFRSCRVEARAMFANGGGSIVNISSISDRIVNRGLAQAHYNSSKAAVTHLSKSLAMEWADRNVRVNVISPGYVLTAMNLRPEVADSRIEIENDTPMKRMAPPEEMVGPAVFLSSRASSFCTGSVLVADGGFSCW